MAGELGYRTLMRLVTGGLGFIGSHLVERLMQSDEVAIVDRRGLDDPNFEELSRLPSFEKVRKFRGDITDYSLIEAALRETRPSVVYHLAASASHRESVRDPYFYVRNNVLSTLNVLEAARKVEPSPTIVFSSSSSVYGKNEPPLREDTPPDPKGPYAMSKLVCEQICKSYSETYGLKCIIDRYFNVVGERCRENIVLKIFVEKVLRGEPVPVRGKWINGEFKPAVRDFTYVGDVVEGTILSGEVNSNFEIFNIGAGRPVSVLELANEVLSLVKETGSKIVYEELEPHETLYSYSDNRKALKMLGWRPKTEVKEIVRRFVEWYLSRRGARA